MITEHPADIVLLDYVEGSLRGDASESVRRHIATCRACRRTLAEISTAISELERLPTAEVPPYEVGQRRSRRRLIAIALRFVPVVLAAAALAVAIVLTRPGTGQNRRGAVPNVLRDQQWHGTIRIGRGQPEDAVRRILKSFGPQVVRRQHGGGLYVIIPAQEYRDALPVLNRHRSDPPPAATGNTVDLTVFFDREQLHQPQWAPGDDQTVAASY
jgi:anti-sigma factor RsiW